MYRTFEVERFRGLLSLKLEDLGRVNVLTGFNDAGKTSVLEALYLHASGPLAGSIAVQTIRAGRQQQELAFGAEAENPWEGLFHDFDMAQGPRFTADTTNGTYQLRLAEAPSGGEQLVGANAGSSDNSGANVTKRVALFEKRGRAAEKRFIQSMSILTTVNPGGSQGVSLQFKLDPPTDGPYARATYVRPNLIPDLATAYSELRKRHSDSDLLEALREVDDRIQRLEVLVTNGRAQLHADLGGPLVPFQLLGDGTSAIAFYVTAMQTSRDGLLLIDEIGTGIHYKALPAMWRAVHRAAKKLNVQLFVTTHSREALQAAAGLARDNASELSVYRLRRGHREEPTIVGQFTGTKLQTALDMNAELR